MKNRSFIAITIVFVLLALTACQPRYIIFPFPGDDIESSNTISINSIDDLKNAANAPDGSQLMLNGFSIDTKTSGLPITFANNVKVSGSIDITEGTNAFMSRSADEPSVVIFRVEGSASVDIADLTVKVAESVADTIKGIVEVTTGTLNASNYNVVTVDSTGNTSSSKTTAGIAIGAGATPEKIQVSDSSVSVTIDTSLDASDFNESFDNVGTGDSGITITTPYDAKDAESFAAVFSEYGKARLTTDIDITEITFNGDHNEFTIDLNDRTLTVTTSDPIRLPSDKTITIKNGTLTTELEGAGLSNANIIFGQNDIVLFDNVTYEGNAGGLALGTDKDSATGSKLTIKDSEFSTKGAFCVATNANKDKNGQVTDNVSITLIDSTFISTNNSFDSCPVFFNITTDLTVSGCTITGDRQALFARGGTVKIYDTDLISTGKFNGENYLDKNWGAGNEAPNAALVVGNRSSAGVYDYDVNVSIDAASSITIQDRTNAAFEVYVSSCNDGRTTTFTSPEFANAVISGEHYYQGEGSTLIIRTDDNASNLVPAGNME